LIKEKRRSLKAHFDLSRVLDMEIKVRGDKRKRKKREKKNGLSDSKRASIVNTCYTWW
jgi:hypothetical protein